MGHKIIIGKEEWCELPELKLPIIKAKVDSGAKTSALHAFNIHVFDQDGDEYVRFEIHPIQNNRKITVKCVTKVIDKRTIKSSNGEIERRIVIKTPIKLGDHVWDIELTLTNRDSMGYKMLLGREAMKGRVLVDPESSFFVNKIEERQAISLYSQNLYKSKSLNILVLASNPELYSNKRLMEAGEMRGHNMKFASVRSCYMNISPNDPGVYYRGGEKLDDIDAVITRLKPSLTFYGCAVARQFEASGAFMLNDSMSITRSRDKLRSLQLLGEKGVNMPVTGFASSPDDTKHLIRLVGGAPLIVKLLEGTQGVGVVLAETNKAAESVINAFKSLKVNILVQEFIKEAKGTDLRCFVVDGKVVGAMLRQATDDDFRANLHLGGIATKVRLSQEEKKMAISATKIMGLEVAGVDILRSDSGPKVIEVNSSPGLEGIEYVTNDDIAGKMIECIERKVLGPKDASGSQKNGGM